MLNTRKKIIDFEYNKKPNHSLANASLVFAAVMLFVFLLNEFDVYLVEKTWMRIATVSSFFLMVLPKFLLLIPNLDTKHSTKYVLMSLITCVTLITCVCLNFHAILVIFFPIFSSMLYCNKRITLIFSIIALVITFTFPIISLAVGSWNPKFFAWFAFGGEFVNSGLMSQFENFDSIPQVMLFISLPNTATLLGFEAIAYFFTANSTISIENNIIVSEMKEKDNLTGLYNQNTYFTFVNDVKPGKLYGVLMFDVNNLKETNDTFGHLEGDELICDCALSVKNILDDNSAAFRLGGDEFVAIFELDNRADILIKLHLWEESFNKVKNEKIRDYSCSMSVGYATGDSEFIVDTVKSADEKMYIAKRKFHETL